MKLPKIYTSQKQPILWYNYVNTYIHLFILNTMLNTVYTVAWEKFSVKKFLLDAMYNEN